MGPGALGSHSGGRSPLHTHTSVLFTHSSQCLVEAARTTLVLGSGFANFATGMGVNGPPPPPLSLH